MLIYSEERLVPTDVNMMTIRAKDNVGYFYVHRSLYDQAVVIDDIYSDTPEMLRKQITGKEDSREDLAIYEEKAPKPLSILSAFLLLVEQPLENFEDMVGAIHVMSGPLHFRNMLKIPIEMRNTPSFSLSIREEYQLAWDRFFQNTMPYSDDMFFRRDTAPMNGTMTTTEPVEGELTNIGDDGVEYGDPLSALLLGAGDDIWDSLDEDEESTEPAPAPAPIPAPAPAPAPIPEPASAPAPEPEPEPEPVVEEHSGIAALLDID